MRVGRSDGLESTLQCPSLLKSGVDSIQVLFQQFQNRLDRLQRILEEKRTQTSYMLVAIVEKGSTLYKYSVEWFHVKREESRIVGDSCRVKMGASSDLPRRSLATQ